MQSDWLLSFGISSVFDSNMNEHAYGSVHFRIEITSFVESIKIAVFIYPKQMNLSQDTRC